MKAPNEKSKEEKSDQERHSKLNVLHREPDAPTAGGPDRDPAAREESSEGVLRGTAEPSENPQSGNALSGLDKEETWENDRASKRDSTSGETPEERRDEQTR